MSAWYQALKSRLSNAVDMLKGVTLIAGAPRVVDSIAALRACPKEGTKRIIVLGYYSAGDGGGGKYYYDASDTTSADDGGSVIVASDGARWKLIFWAALRPEQFGALGDQSGALIGAAATGAPWNVWPSWINDANYLTKPGHDYSAGVRAAPPFSTTDTKDFIGLQLAVWAATGRGGGKVRAAKKYVINRTLRVVQPATGEGVTIEGDHFKNSSIIPLATFAAPIAGVGNPLLYFYKTALAGAIVRNIGLSTFPLTGGTPSPVTDQTVVGPNWESTGTYKCAIALDGADTVMLDGLFLNGYDEAGIVGLNGSSFWVNDLISEYHTIGLVLRGGSNAWLSNPTFSSSSGTGASSWGTTGIYLNGSQAYVDGGQFWNLRGPAIYSTGVNNKFSIKGAVIHTDGYGLLFRCIGLLQWQIADCVMQYGTPNQTPIMLLDNQATGVGDTLNANFLGGQLSGNIVTNTGGVSAQDMLWVNGNNVQIRGNSFLADSSGSSGYVIHGLINGAYNGAGTVGAIFTDNVLKNFALSAVSIFGTVADNVDSAGSQTMAGAWTPAWTGLTLGGPGTVVHTGTLRKVNGICFFTATLTPTGGTTIQSVAGTSFISNLPFTPLIRGANVVASISPTVYAAGGEITTGGAAYAPAWAAVNSAVEVSGWFFA